LQLGIFAAQNLLSIAYKFGKTVHISEYIIQHCVASKKSLANRL